MAATALPAATTQHRHRMARGLKGPHHIYECRRTDIMGSLVQDASPFLFPCTIEYSLICAAILYVMWKNMSRLSGARGLVEPLPPPHAAYKKSPHHYSVDCAGAHKGLFVGILVLVLTIISLILFFVLISRPEFVSLAVMEVNICELTLYAMTTIATLVGMLQVRSVAPACHLFDLCCTWTCVLLCMLQVAPLVIAVAVHHLANRVRYPRV
ncbi:hypothetical protein PR048_027032 [Dryococelus australis]|uniref:Uncharacterized protein n=1 Tax=Dryococelus australis TaxID=614101 RepID=A0ABQ9GG52_9NEOP|nr:hypothetical protein PR048_027032 [Dryococelus australis]